MTVKSRLLLALGLPVLLLAIVLVTSFRGLGNINDNVISLHDDRVVPLKQLKLVADAYAVQVIDAVNKGNAGLFSAAETRQSLSDAQSIIKREWQTYTQTRLTEEEAALVQKAQSQLRDADQAIAAVMQFLSGKEGDLSGQLEQFDGELYTQIDPISTTVSDLVNLQLRVAGEVRNDIDATANSMLWTFGVLAVLALGLLTAAGWWLYHAISGPLHELSGTMGTAQRNLDLRLTVHANRDDEWGEAGQSFNAMLGSFRQVVEQVRQVVDATAERAGVMRKAVDEVSGAADGQQREADQIATAATEMTASIGEVARNAVAAAEAARRAAAATQSGREAVDNVAHSLEQLHEDIAQANTVIGQLGERSESIGQVLDVIRAIAEQTNLLALNAAIEAARAGEQGRGFAVVADEVRNLAQRTQQSTAEIADIIQQLQGASRQAVDRMRASLGSTEKSNAMAQSARGRLDDIDKANHMIGDMNNQIAAATEEQAAVSESISRNMVRIQDLSNTVAGGNARVRASTEDVQGELHTLRQLAAKFIV